MRIKSSALHVLVFIIIALIVVVVGIFLVMKLYQSSNQGLEKVNKTTDVNLTNLSKQAFNG